MDTEKKELKVSRPEYLGGGEWKIVSPNRVNVILGRNGCGKSVLLRALRDINQQSSHYIVPERTGEISFEAGLIVETTSPAGRRKRSTGNFYESYRQSIVTRIQTYYTTRGTKNVEDIDHNPEDLMKSLSIILPDFKVNIKSESPFYELKRIRNDEIVKSVKSLSSGESQLLTLGMDILTIVGIWRIDKFKECTLLIDEPDAHIHQDLQIKFADFINSISHAYNIQIFIATHSTTLLSALGQFGKTDVSIFYLKNEESKIKGKRYDKISKEISTFLGGHLIMGPLFATPILLVEGDDDYRTWIMVARSGEADICVLPCNGDEIKKYRNTLENMFDVLSEDIKLRGIAIIDGDKSVPQNQSSSPQNFVSFMQLQCHESENLYLSDEVLFELGYSWEVAKSKIKEESVNYGNKKDALGDIDNIDRQFGDIKNIINEIADVLDPKKLFWTVRVGKVLGNKIPTGMLADYIGKDIIDAVWSNH